MSRRCELTGKSPMVGNNVSHANNKTKRRFLPNLNEVTLTSETLGQTHRFRISASALRSVDHRGGLDAFLAKAARRRAVAEGAEAQARDRQGAGRLPRLPSGPAVLSAAPDAAAALRGGVGDSEVSIPALRTAAAPSAQNPRLSL